MSRTQVFAAITLSLVMLGVIVTSPGSARAGLMADDPTLDPDWIETIQWRSIGPANMMGRCIAFAVYEKDPCIYWVATASGGLLKTTNNGVTYEHQFDGESTVSIGHVAVAQSDPNIVWVGTGEANPRNSVSYGDGVYKSTDGGATWKNMGLKKSFQIGRIAIHPDDPNTVYIGALGRLYGPNEERGLYKTSDGGETWEKILHVDDKTGVIDVDMHPSDPYTLLVATYERARDGFDTNDPAVKWGPGSGIHKTTDGGKTWTHVTEGLPTVNIGRIGMDYYRADPNIVYAVVESERITKLDPQSASMGVSTESADVGARLTEIVDEGPAANAGLEAGDIVLAVGDEKIGSAEHLTKAIRNATAGDEVTIEFVREREFNTTDLTFGEIDGDGTIREFSSGLGGQRENLQDQQGLTSHEAGGIYRSENGGDTWTRINSLNPRPMYYSQIRVDPSDNQHIYVLGTSLYRSSDGGETFTSDGGRGGVHVDHHALWVDPSDGRHIRLGNDGGLYITHSRMDEWEHNNKMAIGQFYHATFDPRPFYNVYGGMQDNGSWGGPGRTRGGSSTVNSDWFRVGSGDGFVCLVDPNDPDQIYFESQNGGTGRINLRTGERGFIRPRAPRGTRYRFNWKTPFILSNFNSQIYYSAGNHVFRSLNKGDGVEAISPEITATDRGAGSALAESPRDAGVLYVGTTDGALWVTRDGGDEWIDLFALNSPSDESETTEADESAGDQPAASSARQAAMIRQMMSRLDRNGDGAISQDEVPERMQGMFERFDGNGDGVIDEKDIGEAAAPAGEAPTGDIVSGTWNATLSGAGIPAGAENFTLTLALEGKTVSGSFKANVLNGDSSDGNWDGPSRTVNVTFDAAQGSIKLVGTIDGDTMSGTIDVGDGLFTVKFTADRGEAAAMPAAATPEPPVQEVEVAEAEAALQNVTGSWDGELIADQIPAGQAAFSLELEVDGDKVTGTAASDQGEAEVNGTFDPKSGKLVVKLMADDFEADLTGTVVGDKMTGRIVAGAGMEIDFEAKRIKREACVEDESFDAPTPAPGAAAQQGGFAADVVSGDWECEFISDQIPAGAGTFTMTMQLKDGKVTGTFNSRFTDADIEKGSFNEETGKLTLVVVGEQGDIDIEATIKDGKLTGELSAGGGGFVVDIEGKRTKSAAVEEPVEEAVEEVVEAEVEVEVEESAAADDLPLSGTIDQLLPKRMWVSSIEASRHSDGRVYVTFDGHRSDNDDPWVFVSEDHGASWKSLRGNLPRGSSRVIREDLENPNVLYLGTEFAAWVSINRGESWTRLNSNLPTVAIHELAQHPSTGEILAATHGRSLWIADISPIRQMTEEVLASDAHLFKPTTAYFSRPAQSRGVSGLQGFRGQQSGGQGSIYYLLNGKVDDVKLTVQDHTGRVIRELNTSGDAGLHRASWDLRESATGGAAARRGGGRGGNFRGRGGRFAQPGRYLVVLEADGERMTQEITVANDPEDSGARFALEELRLFEEEAAELGIGEDDEEGEPGEAIDD